MTLSGLVSRGSQCAPPAGRESNFLPCTGLPAHAAGTGGAINEDLAAAAAFPVASYVPGGLFFRYRKRGFADCPVGRQSPQELLLHSGHVAPANARSVRSGCIAAAGLPRAATRAATGGHRGKCGKREGKCGKREGRGGYVGRARANPRDRRNILQVRESTTDA